MSGYIARDRHGSLYWFRDHPIWREPEGVWLPHTETSGEQSYKFISDEYEHIGPGEVRRYMEPNATTRSAIEEAERADR